MSAPLDFFQYKKGVLSVDGVSLSEIADSVGTPAYIYSAEAFLKPLRALQKGLSKVDHLICFAVKSNSNLAILKLLGDAGAGVDLVSGGELFRAKSVGIPGDRVVFSGVGKTRGEMARALEYESDPIFSFNVESAEELLTLDAVAKNIGKVATVALRFNPDVDPKTHPYISTGLKKNKFGMPRAEVLSIAKQARKYEGLKIRGISIHIGSQLLSLSPLEDAFKRVRAMVRELNSVLPEPLSYVDLGGGVGIRYKDEKPPRVEDYCALILKYFGPSAKLENPLKLLIEPGRLLSGNSGILVTEVLYRKTHPKKDFLIVDAAMNDLMRPSLYGSYHEILPVKKSLNSGSKKKTDIVGPVCESADCFAGDRALSQKLGRGDLLAILSAGAYGFTMASNYNSRPRPPEVLVQQGNFSVIRERETYDDLVRGESI